ncbi:Origin recognition complex subunit 3-like protein [Elsinoe fawcettii]|nr:Origin recognition complex subunit 3-like protein [Elsinoe fawcettii]
MEYETCYVFKPEEYTHERSAKRRRIGEHKGLHSSWPRRRALFERLWTEHQAKLNDALSELNLQTVTDVTDFFVNTTIDEKDPKLDSAILVTGPSLISQSVITRQIHGKAKQRTRTCFVSFHAGEANNLKAVLKRINAATSTVDIAEDDDEADEQVSGARSGRKLLNYDLRISQQAVEDQNITKVVISFQDCEAFDGGLLSDVIELLSCWKDRIPFVLMFGVATSVETLQSKLTRRAIRCLRGRRFDATNAEATLENVFAQVYFPDCGLWLGSGFSSQLLARQRDFLANPQSIIDSAQYAYMTHFYANATSLFLDNQVPVSAIPKDHFEAIRNLPSFMQLVDDLLNQENPEPREVRQLLQSNEHLYDRIRGDVQTGQQAIRKIVSTARMYHSLHLDLEGVEQLPESEILLQAVGGSLLDSARLKTFFLVLKRVTSTVLRALIGKINDHDPPVYSPFSKVHDRLDALLEEHGEANGPLRSEVDIQNSTMRTTVISKKISLSKAKTTLTKADAAYSEILNDFIKSLHRYLTDTLIDPKTLPFHEIFLFDLKSPYRQTFTPRPRHAVERALSSPHDYLNCACCAPKTGDEEESTLSATQPPSAILYQLYLESGLMVNAADLRSAFAAILGDKVEDEEILNAVFLRSLAELSHLGLVKGTKKKADHLIKTAWKGL